MNNRDKFCVTGDVSLRARHDGLVLISNAVPDTVISVCRDACSSIHDFLELLHVIKVVDDHSIAEMLHIVVCNMLLGGSCNCIVMLIDTHSVQHLVFAAEKLVNFLVSCVISKDLSRQKLHA